MTPKPEPGPGPVWIVRRPGGGFAAAAHLTVKCPRCGAPAGELCRARTTHPERARLADDVAALVDGLPDAS